MLHTLRWTIAPEVASENVQFKWVTVGCGVAATIGVPLCPKRLTHPCTLVFGMVHPQIGRTHILFSGTSCLIISS